MIENFLTIPDAPNYEVNSKGVVRNKKNGKILKSKKRIGKDYFVVTVFNNGHPIKRDVMTFRRQAEVAVKDAKRNFEYWIKIPSLNYLYEINSFGTLRNVKTKKVKKIQRIRSFRFYALSINNKSINRSVKDLLFEAHGVCFPPSHCTPVKSFINLL